MSPSQALLATARRAVEARQVWNEARAALRVENLPPLLDARARERARVAQRNFHMANNFLASIVCQEFGVGLPGIDMRPPSMPAPQSARAAIAGWCPPLGTLGRIRSRVCRAREAYHAVDANDSRAMAAARAAFFAALIEYFDVREQDGTEHSLAAE